MSETHHLRASIAESIALFQSGCMDAEHLRRVTAENLELAQEHDLTLADAVSLRTEIEQAIMERAR